jgi:hypothetical protein
MRMVEAGTLMSDWSGGSEGKGGRRMTEGRGERARGTPDITIHDPDDIIEGVARGESGERTTGTPNTIYDLSSVLFHALEGGASYDTYIEDAEREGDQELAAFFRRVRDEDSVRADDARLLLAKRTPTTAQTEDKDLDAAAAEGTAPGVAATEDSEPELPSSTEPPRGEGTAPGAPATEDLTPGVAATEGSEPDVSPEPPGGPPGTEPRAEGATPRAEAGQAPRTEPISAPPRPGDVPSRRTEEIPPRTEGGPLAEEVPSGTPPQAPPGDVQREPRPESPASREETSPSAEEASLDPPTEEEKEMARRQAARDRGEEDEGLIDKVRDTLFGEEERSREGTAREDRR